MPVHLQQSWINIITLHSILYSDKQIHNSQNWSLTSYDHISLFLHGVDPVNYSENCIIYVNSLLKNVNDVSDKLMWQWIPGVIFNCIFTQIIQSNFIVMSNNMLKQKYNITLPRLLKQSTWAFFYLVDDVPIRLRPLVGCHGYPGKSPEAWRE